jgi:K+-transporting ATPase ATPase A chain
MSYLSQLLLAGQNFLAGAAGLAVGVDLIRAVLWVLLPVSLVGSLFLVAQGPESS